MKLVIIFCILLHVSSSSQEIPDYLKPNATTDQPLRDNAFTLVSLENHKLQMKIHIANEKLSRKDSTDPMIYFWRESSNELFQVPYIVNSRLERDDTHEFDVTIQISDHAELGNQSNLRALKNEVRIGVNYQFYYNYFHVLAEITQDDEKIGNLLLFNIEPRNERTILIIPPELKGDFPVDINENE